MSTAQAELRELGARILSDTPVRSGYLEGLGGYSTLAGPFASLEVGHRFTPSLGMGGLLRWTQSETFAGLVARMNF